LLEKGSGTGTATGFLFTRAILDHALREGSDYSEGQGGKGLQDGGDYDKNT
jgi:hypothetical protein